MTRRHIPVAIMYPTPTPIVVGSVPTFDTKRRYGFDALRGLVMAGSLAAVVPIRAPWAGQGLVSPVFPLVQPSSVAPNARRTVLNTFINLYSPSSHSKPAHTDEPVPAQQPDPTDAGWAMPKKYGKGTAGRFTLPAAPNIPQWPVFVDRMAR